MKHGVLAIILLVLASVGCLAQALPTLTPEPLVELPTLTPISTPISNLDTSSAMEETCLIVTANKTLYLRHDPTTNSPVVGWFQYGEKVYAVESVGKWWHLSNGYVHSAYVKECNVHSKAQSKRR